MTKAKFPNLDDAIATGRGVERAFKCDVHDGDNPVSASVNILKNVWYCYVCGARGTTDGKGKAPSLEALRAMTEPEAIARIYPESALDLYDVPPRWRAAHYWASRFPDWLIRYARFGQDPFTSEATFPVRDRQGRLAGVARRISDEAVAEAKAKGTNPSRYRYPRGWSASTTLHGWPTLERGHIIVLVEGVADWAALTECGIFALSHYGSGIHYPQAELVPRLNPPLVLLGQDADNAGEKGAMRTRQALGNLVPCARVRWPAKDPGDCTPQQRVEAVLETVAGSVYGDRYNADDLRVSFSSRINALQTSLQEQP